MLFDVAWDLKESELQPTLEEKEPYGFRVKGITKYGPAASPRHALLFHQTHGPHQRIRPRLYEAELAEGVLPVHNSMRFPALVAGTAVGGPAVYSVVFEHLGLDDVVHSARPAFLLPQSWARFNKATTGVHFGLRLRSIAITGVRFATDDDDLPGDLFLSYAGTLWPQPRKEPWARWSVRLGTRDPVQPNAWKWAFDIATWRNHSDVQLAAGASSSDFLSDALPKEPLVTVWSDERYQPWPPGDPFATDILGFGHDVRVDAVPLADAPGAVAASAPYRLLLSVAVHGAAGRETAVLVWSASNHHVPLPRRFHFVGPGDGRGAPPSSPGAVVRPPLPYAIAWAGGRARAVSDVYEATQISDRIMRVEPRFPGSDDAVPRNYAIDDGLDYGTLADQPTLQPPAPTVSIRRFDTIMHGMMRRGARAAFLVVLRRGELKFARAYTLAEEGYPVTALNDRFRLASVSKAITATLLRRQFLNISGGLENRLADELGVDPQFDALREATLAQACRHATGLITTYVGTIAGHEVVDLSNQSDPDDDARPRHLLALGTVRHWYGNYSEGVGVPYEAGEIVQYNNYVFSCLAEVVGRRALGWYDRWEEAFVGAFAEAGASSIQYALGARAYRTCQARGEVPYHGPPGAASNRWRRVATMEGPAEEPMPFVPLAYDADIDVYGGGGGIAISALDLARFLAALTPRPDAFHWMRYTHSFALTTGDSTISGGVNQGLGWGVVRNVPWTTRTAGADVPHVRTLMQHNGALYGTASWVLHLKASAFNSSAANQIDTVSIGVAFNSDIPLDMDADMRDGLLAEAQRIELSDGWLDGDLFRLGEIL